jgi:hypothetical protein
VCIQHFLDNRLTDGREVVNPIRRPPRSFPKEILSTYFSRCVNPRTILQLEGLGKLKECSDFVGPGTDI